MLNGVKERLRTGDHSRNVRAVRRCPRQEPSCRKPAHPADMSLKYALLGYNRKMLDGAIENIVFLELKRRGYDVYIGKNGTKEIDFVADKRGERIYVQVCVRLPENSNRETGNLMEIADNYPKYVVTLNDLDTGIENGIKVVHLYDFLTAESW